VLENAGAPVTEPRHLQRAASRRDILRARARYPPGAIVNLHPPRPFQRAQQQQPASMSEVVFGSRNAAMAAGRPVNQDRNVAPVPGERTAFVVNPPPIVQQGGQVQRPPPPTIDNDWWREVDQALGGITDMHRLQMENLQVLQGQTTPQRLQEVRQQAQQQLQAAQQQLQHRDAQGPQQPQQPQRAAQRAAARAVPPHMRVAGVGDRPMAEQEVVHYATVRRMLEWEDSRLAGRRRSAPTPTNVSAAAGGGGGARSPLPS
jgi:hypothetical protein